MAMNFTFYRNSSENNRINKKLTELGTISGNLKNESSIIDPTIQMHNTKTSKNNQLQYSDANYIYIPKFKRYYFVNDVKTINESLIEISCHVDVLYSFKDDIISCSGILAKTQGKDSNLFIDDGNLFVTNETLIESKRFGIVGNIKSSRFVLSVAGDGT